MSVRPELVNRAQQYCQRRGLEVGPQLGIVFAAATQGEAGRLAIKIHEGAIGYLRLQEHAVTDIRGCTVPELLRFDDELWVIEMTVVSRPFVLDFAGAYLDRPPDFSDEVHAEWEAEKLEQSGSRWPEVRAILASLEGYGVFMLDVNPGNIAFRE